MRHPPERRAASHLPIATTGSRRPSVTWGWNPPQSNQTKSLTLQTPPQIAMTARFQMDDRKWSRHSETTTACHPVGSNTSKCPDLGRTTNEPSLATRSHPTAMPDSVCADLLQ